MSIKNIVSFFVALFVVFVCGSSAFAVDFSEAELQSQYTLTGGSQYFTIEKDGKEYLIARNDNGKFLGREKLGKVGQFYVNSPMGMTTEEALVQGMVDVRGEDFSGGGYTAGEKRSSNSSPAGLPYIEPGGNHFNSMEVRFDLSKMNSAGYGYNRLINSRRKSFASKFSKFLAEYMKNKASGFSAGYRDPAYLARYHEGFGKSANEDLVCFMVDAQEFLSSLSAEQIRVLNKAFNKDQNRRLFGFGPKVSYYGEQSMLETASSILANLSSAMSSLATCNNLDVAMPVAIKAAAKGKTTSEIIAEVEEVVHVVVGGGHVPHGV